MKREGGYWGILPGLSDFECSPDTLFGQEYFQYAPPRPFAEPFNFELLAVSLERKILLFVGKTALFLFLIHLESEKQILLQPHKTNGSLPTFNSADGQCPPPTLSYVALE